MKLVNFSATNFRSISKAVNIPILDVTVLVGKNNEGKSNLLKALAVAMDAINTYSKNGLRSRKAPLSRSGLSRLSESRYSWARDFPIALQGKGTKSKSWFRLEFELSQDERIKFQEEIGSSCNGVLPIEVEIGKDEIAAITVRKGGKANAPWKAKSDKISDYIAKNISFNYIPAIRTHQEALQVIDDILFSELSSLKDNSEYKKALDAIDTIQKSFLEDLSIKIKQPLSEFLPSIKKVQIIGAEHYARGIGRGNFDVIIDDGTPTSIEYKGDGVKSLATLGLLKNRSNKTAASIIAIEEPESHLHPEAIHQLQSIVQALGTEHQIVLSTHNPLFVNRKSISSNIIISDGKALQANSIKSIREVLGVLVSDNLVSSRYSLFVEGKGDQISLEALLSYLSPKIKTALRNSDFIIIPLGGVSHLAHTLSSYEKQIYSYHVFIDNDVPAREAYDKAVSTAGLEIRSITYSSCKGMKESELEDCINVKCYITEVHLKFGVHLSGTSFKGKEKWSERVEKCFLDAHKPWNKAIKMNVKALVAECISKAPDKALCECKGDAVIALAKRLEELIVPFK